MAKQNMHIHTKYSFDCNLELEEIVKILISNDIKEAAFTDHVEFMMERVKVEDVVESMKKRNKEIDELNKKYPKIRILKGVEIGSPHLYKDKVARLQELDFDFIMGSVHKIDKQAKTSLAQRQASLLYYREVLEMVKAKQIDVVGHIDYINRYYDRDYSDQRELSEIFNEIKKNNMIIEVNASAKRRTSLGQPCFPSSDKLALYKKFKKEIIVGTDAHKLDELFENLSRTEYLVNTLGLEEVTFKERKLIKQ